MRWVTGIPDQSDGEAPVEALVRRTRTYRAILNVLPEFTLQRRSDIERALKIIFSVETRWTWLEQETAIGILKLIPSIDILQAIQNIFENLSPHDSATLAVELWLLLELSSFQLQELEKLCSQIQNLLNLDSTQNTALALAVHYDLKVDVSACNTSKIKIEFEKHYRKQVRKDPLERGEQLQKLISFQPKEKQLELLLSVNLLWRMRSIIIPRSWQFLVKHLLPEKEISILEDSVTLRVRYYLCRQPLMPNALKTLNKIIDEVQNIQAKYLRAIIEAIQNPTDNDLDNKVRALETQLPNKNVYPGWRASNILGPSPSDFCSIESWKEFKQEIARLSSSDPKWVEKSIDFEESSNLWTCLLFHPDHWSLLVDESLITENERNNFLNTPLGRILSMSRIPLDIFSGTSILSDEPDEIPLHKILHVALSIFSYEGADRISAAKGLEFLSFYQWEFHKTVSAVDLDALLHQANSLPSLPSTWANAILILCMNVPDIDIELLLDFWEKQPRPRLRVFHEEGLPSEWNQILERLLSSNRVSALDFGVVILSCAKPIKQIQDALSVRLLNESSRYINNDNVSFELYCTALFNLDPGLEEFLLWSKPQIIELMQESVWMIDGLRRRFSSAADPRSKLDHQQLRKQFLIFITNRHDYPESISLGALEAILKIDEANLPALETKTWQQDFDQ